MALLFEGRIADLILFIIFNGVILFLIYQARGGKVFTLKKRLAGLDAIPEAVGRAVEMGRPVHFTPGGSGLTGVRGTHIQAGLVIGGHVASYCARLGAHLIMSLAAPAQIPLTEEIYRTAYTINPRSIISLFFCTVEMNITHFRVHHLWTPADFLWNRVR